MENKGMNGKKSSVNKKYFTFVSPPFPSSEDCKAAG
jgi:hypothetical protein